MRRIAATAVVVLTLGSGCGGSHGPAITTGRLGGKRTPACAKRHHRHDHAKVHGRIPGSRC